MIRLKFLLVTCVCALFFSGCGSSSPESELKKGLAEFERGRYSDTINHLNRAAEGITDSADLYYTLGLAYLHLGDMDKALEALNKTVDITPAHCEALVCLGQIAFHKSEFDYSRKYYETALKLAPEPRTKAVLYTSLALTESGLKNDGLARLYLIRSLSCDSGYVPAMYNLATLYRDKFGFKEAALDYFQAYVQRAQHDEPHYEKAQNNISRLESNLERSETGSSTARDAVAAAKALESAVNFQVQKKYRDAIRAFDAALAADPGAFNAAYGRAMAYMRLNDSREAFKAFKQALEINPGHQDCYVNAITIALNLRFYDDAVVMLDRAISRNPQFVSWYDLMARVLYGQAKYKDALQYGEYYLSLMKPSDPGRDAYESWVKALRDAG